MNRYSHTKVLAEIAAFSSILAICSWIIIPMTVPFTLQTAGVFLCILLLGSKKAEIALLVYILIGLCGAPVFAGFHGGVSVLFGATGGYIIGFLAMPPVSFLFEKLNHKNNKIITASGLFVSLAVCYLFGTAWFSVLYFNSGLSFFAILSKCVLPFIISDTVKLLIALYISERIKAIKGKR